MTEMGRLDGVIAKRLDASDRAGEREVLLESKQLRTVDCVARSDAFVTGATPLRWRPDKAPRASRFAQVGFTRSRPTVLTA